MSRRWLAFIGVAIVSVAVVGLLKLTPVPAVAQAPTATAKTAAAAQTGPALKTSWGEPDLQGLWSDEYQIPLQRPAKYAGKESFTDAELAALDKERAAKPSFGEKRGEKGTERDVAGAYN